MLSSVKQILLVITRRMMHTWRPSEKLSTYTSLACIVAPSLFWKLPQLPLVAASAVGPKCGTQMWYRVASSPSH